MTVLVAVPEGREGPQALDAGITEARLLDTDLVVLNLTLSTIDVSGVPEDLKVTLLERSGPGDRDPADAVKLLIEAGANPNAVNPKGDTALHIAAHDGNCLLYTSPSPRDS